MAANSDSSEYGDGRGNRGAQRAERLAGAGVAGVPGRPHGEGVHPTTRRRRRRRRLEREKGLFAKTGDPGTRPLAVG